MRRLPNGSPALITGLCLTLAVSLFISPGFAALQTTPPNSPTTAWVTQDAAGHLHYRSTEKGDTIPDFSHAGYEGGGVSLPVVPTKKTVAPSDSGGDDTLAIQKALDAVAHLPLQDGFRGAVLLEPGTFHCAKTITLSQTGIVLRGSGSGEKGTVIAMTGEPHLCLQILGNEVRVPEIDSTPGISITDVYVPAGAQRVTVSDASGLKVGDSIIIERKFTAKWIQSLGMDILVRDGKPQTWIHPDKEMTYERTVRSVDGNKIGLDLPMPDAIDAQLMAPEVPKVFKVHPPAPRLAQCGIESLQITSPPPSGNLTTPNNHGIDLNHCEDCWVKDVTMKDTTTNIHVLDGGRRLTIEGATAFHSTLPDDSKGAAGDFMIRGSQVLLDRCSATGTGAFFVATADTGAMLNVVLNCNFNGQGGIQPHMRWSTALLLDNCNLPDGKIALHNRGFAGSGQGWAIAWAVAWNCSASLFKIGQPPGAFNWCIGCLGTPDKKLGINAGYSSFGIPVLPQSLYLAQLQERLGPGALKNIGY